MAVHSPTTTAGEVLLTQRVGTVLVITFNRPHRLNAWTDELEDAYSAALLAADADPDVRAIVVTGARRGFCAGADMDDLSAARDASDANIDRLRPRHLPLTIRKPIVAAVNGAAAGLGLCEALFADVRFASPEAARIGLVQFLVPADELLERAVAYAADLAEACSPWSMATIKSQLQLDSERSFAESVEAADVLMRESFRGSDIAEGVASFTERRPPVFAPLPPKEN